MIESTCVEMLGKWIAHARLIRPEPAQLTIRQRAAVALLQVCRDHCMSIYILLHKGDGYTTASELALLRPALEACLKGGWLGKCLTDEGFLAYESNFQKDFFNRKQCLDALKEKIDATSHASLSMHVEKVHKIYHDFAHGGHQQILRRFAEDGSIGTQGTDEEQRFIVEKALLYDFVASQWIADEMGDEGLKRGLIALMAELNPVSALRR